MTKTLYKMALPLFAVMNGATIYLFWLHLPYGWYPMEMSFIHWGEAPLDSGTATVIGFSVALITLVLTTKLGRDLKAKLVFFARENAHPGSRVFLGDGSPGIDRKPLYEAYPAVKESAYDPAVQFEVWCRLRDKHLDKDIVARPRQAWHVIQDLFALSLMFIPIFLIAWLINNAMPFEIVLRYIFILGAQAFFLMLAARSVGNRYALNVLAAELGYKLGDRPGEDEDDK